MFYVYFMQSEIDNRLYVGSTNDLRARLKRHNEGGSEYTRKFRPWHLVYYEAYASEHLAKERERKLKQHGKRYTSVVDRIFDDKYQKVQHGKRGSNT